MAIHKLKIYPQYYDAVDKGIKTFELRLNDRNYHVGDTLVLREMKPGQTYTGRETAVTVTYVLEGVYGLVKGYCVLGIEREQEQ